MDSQPKPRLGRKIKVVLAISLALNLLFIGLFAGAALRHGGKGGPGGARMQGYGAPYVQALPREQRRALKDALQQSGVVPQRETRRALYQKVLTGLRAEPFDTDAVRAVLEHQRDFLSGALGATQIEWLKLVEGMSESERQAYADALEERLKRGPRRRGHKNAGE